MKSNALISKKPNYGEIAKFLLVSFGVFALIKFIEEMEQFKNLYASNPNNAKLINMALSGAGTTAVIFKALKMKDKTLALSLLSGTGTAFLHDVARYVRDMLPPDTQTKLAFLGEDESTVLNKVNQELQNLSTSGIIPANNRVDQMLQLIHESSPDELRKVIYLAGQQPATTEIPLEFAGDDDDVYALGNPDELQLEFAGDDVYALNGYHY